MTPYYVTMLDVPESDYEAYNNWFKPSLTYGYRRRVPGCALYVETDAVRVVKPLNIVRGGASIMGTLLVLIVLLCRECYTEHIKGMGQLYKTLGLEDTLYLILIAIAIVLATWRIVVALTNGNEEAKLEERARIDKFTIVNVEIKGTRTLIRYLKAGRPFILEATCSSEDEAQRLKDDVNALLRSDSAGPL